MSNSQTFSCTAENAAMYGDNSQPDWFHLLLREPAAFGLLLAISLVPTGILGWGALVDRRIEAEGVSASGTVDWASVSHSRDNFGGSGDTYSVHYRFSPPGDKQQYRPYWVHRLVSVEIPKKVYDRVRRGGRIDVRYLRGQPQANRPKQSLVIERLAQFLSLSLMVNVVLLAGVFVAGYFRGLSRRTARDPSRGMASTDPWHAPDDPRGYVLDTGR